MVLEKMDSVVCNALTGQQLPVHFYLKFLNYGINCLREINMDVMRNVIAVRLPLSDTGAARVPCDFLDWVNVGVQVGQYIKPLTEKQNINRLRNVDATTGEIIEYPRTQIRRWAGFRDDLFPGYYGSWINIANDRGEATGGIFGWGNGNEKFSFKYVKERGEIQVDSNMPQDSLYLEYISDGLDKCGCDTMINPYAYDTIKNYMIWQYHLNTKKLMRMAPMWEQQYSTSLSILRARMSPITPADIIAVMRRNYKATNKN